MTHAALKDLFSLLMNEPFAETTLGDILCAEVTAEGLRPYVERVQAKYLAAISAMDGEAVDPVDRYLSLSMRHLAAEDDDGSACEALWKEMTQDQRDEANRIVSAAINSMDTTPPAPQATPSPAPQGGGDASPVFQECARRLVEQVRGSQYGLQFANGSIREGRRFSDAELAVTIIALDRLATPPAQQPGEVVKDADEIAELRRNYDGAKRWLFALAMEQGGSVTVSRQTLYRMRPDDRLTMMESPSGDAYRLTAALAPKEKGNG